ncbi:hypothetical protein DV737_g3799, partial [Chaetothyriales sp. CBS 132003]
MVASLTFDKIGSLREDSRGGFLVTEYIDPNTTAFPEERARAFQNLDAKYRGPFSTVSEFYHARCVYGKAYAWIGPEEENLDDTLEDFETLDAIIPKFQMDKYEHGPFVLFHDFLTVLSAPTSLLKQRLTGVPDAGGEVPMTMVELIYAPDPHALLAPVLACLPTAFASARPPPALLPLLSPILRQRLQVSLDPRDNWLKLLCWDPDRAEILKDNVENSIFEPHPVSGEIEIGEIESTTYKRLDDETLKCQIQLEDWAFTPIFLWCSGDDEGRGWKLAEILPAPETDDSWSASIAEANESANERIIEEALEEADAAQPGQDASLSRNEDDYWAQYDQTPSRTPLQKSSVATGRQPASDADYYAQYGKVQPAMDNHDPDEEVANVTEARLNGHVLAASMGRLSGRPAEREPAPYHASRDHAEEADGAYRAEQDNDVEVLQPVPDSPRSKGSSGAIARLEDEAERYNASEVGIRQHIGTSMKSMYRLAKSVGMERDEFERIVNRELETLSILDRDD